MYDCTAHVREECSCWQNPMSTLQLEVLPRPEVIGSQRRPVTLRDRRNYFIEGSLVGIHASTMAMEATEKVAEPRGHAKTYSLNSTRLTASVVSRIATALGLPKVSSLADSRQMIEGLLAEKREPRNVQVVESGMSPYTPSRPFQYGP